jgi:hypothetical protein
MATVFFQKWKGPSGYQRFTTIHLSEEDALRFRKAVEERKLKGQWKSALVSERVLSKEVSNKVYDIVVRWLGNKSGKRGQISIFTQYEWV